MSTFPLRVSESWYDVSSAGHGAWHGVYPGQPLTKGARPLARPYMANVGILLPEKGAFGQGIVAFLAKGLVHSGMGSGACGAWVLVHFFALLCI